MPADAAGALAGALKGVKIAPSILAADFARLGEQAVEAAAAGAHYLHVDVMDGHFVPHITLGHNTVAALRGLVTIPIEVHLMVEEPERQVPLFVEAGADTLIVHVEATPHLHRVVGAIQAAGRRAGVALNPGTPLAALEEVLPLLDQVLVMTVNPGQGGQAFIREMLPKIARLRRSLDEADLRAELEVDGGVSVATVAGAVVAGARVLVAGTAVYTPARSVAEAMGQLGTCVLEVAGLALTPTEGWRAEAKRGSFAASAGSAYRY